MRKKLAIFGLSIVAVLFGGCPAPPADDGDDSVVQVVAGASITSGAAPLTVLFSGVNSASPNGGPFTFAWDFADGTTSTAPEVSHTFANPGLYGVRLTVTDGAGAAGVGGAEIRVRGVGATAVITADRSSGPAPLLVRFDGRNSSAPDDTIRDYFWDFGDGQVDRTPNPTHSFAGAGVYTVALRVVTAGGVENSTTLDVRVDAGSASLDFASNDRATLPVTNVGTSNTLQRLTVECWMRSGASGGTVFNLGNGSVVAAVDAKNNQIVLTLSGASVNLPASNLVEQWRHLAVTYNSGGIGATVYLDGAPIGTAPAASPSERTVGPLVLGGSFEGAISEVRLWTVARTAVEIGEARSQRLTNATPGLSRVWPMSAGSGQFLAEILGNDTGVRGATTAEEASDPAWTTDAPPIE